MPYNRELWTDFPSLQLVRTGRWMRLFGRLTFILLISSIFLLFAVPWQQTARGIGSVVALDPQERPQPVLSPAKGLIKYVKPGLREGSFVEQGELLIRLVPYAEEGVAQIDTQIVAIESKRAAAESSLDVAEQAAVLQESSGQSLTQSLKQEREAALQKWEQMKSEVISLQAEMEDKRNQLRIAEEVAVQGLVSKEELFSKQRAVEAHQAKLLKAEGAVEEAYAKLLSKQEEIEAKFRDIDIKNRNANQKILDSLQKLRTIEKELSETQTKRDELNRLEIVAPRSGYIQQWFGLEGSDTVSQKDQLFVIVPDTTDLAVEMAVSGNDMPLVQEGALVRLQFEGWPAVQFVGWPSVAVGTFSGRINRISPTDNGKGKFRVLVVPDPEDPLQSEWPDSRYLRQGVRANGWVLLNQVPLGYEIWRQLNGFPPVVSDEPPKSDKKGSKVKLPKL